MLVRYNRSECATVTTPVANSTTLGGLKTPWNFSTSNPLTTATPWRVSCMPWAQRALICSTPFPSVKCIFRYLKATRNLGLWFPQTTLGQ
ncbi:hypothetical protein BDK51DRAFT_49424 [Blyttiomyces helicus]|uniref:Uncharacterized protein n=1 Tax=Blyttiomyces helicus TaxID=388810 RepID=A0A4P9VWM8_9FUNG|nr:hypothetical protein BDK51DRAFT_49424 [Blyttiomyces helicus]|eukprot:RKO84104.1 hypothetical protein BDK51DRAFT_49424 [Blyttiomyces helicus]